MCLWIHYALCAFFFVWGVIYPTVVFFFLRNSWTRLRCGLVIDATVFLTAIGALWSFGEDKYPPGDAPLHVAILGRPAICLLAAATFNLPNRRRMVALGAHLGLFHVKVGLDELGRGEMRRMLSQSGHGAPNLSLIHI